ncbi:MAG TPA: hypothetical protein ENK18_20515 [Deltaproteobacteria bacterium]|nr:hypothetical protein [Deltaproteobacteria bacterium]
MRLSPPLLALAGLVPTLLAGSVLWLDRSGPWLLAARSAAIGAALVVVGVELLPHAVGSLGPIALGVALGGALAVAALERRSASHGGAGLGLSLAGLGLHQGLDGLQIGALAGPLGLPVLLAIGLHALPLVAVGLMISARHLGRPAALLVWSGLLLSTAAGLAVGMAIPTAKITPWVPWLQAAMSGLLLHMLLHDLVPTIQARSLRPAILGGLLLGAASVLVLLHPHRHEQRHPPPPSSPPAGPSPGGSSETAT